jgi:hypothetical protein
MADHDARGKRRPAEAAAHATCETRMAERRPAVETGHARKAGATRQARSAEAGATHPAAQAAGQRGVRETCRSRTATHKCAGPHALAKTAGHSGTKAAAGTATVATSHATADATVAVAIAIAAAPAALGRGDLRRKREQRHERAVREPRQNSTFHGEILLVCKDKPRPRRCRSGVPRSVAVRCKMR